ncbi:MAG: helix-turn-helix domain-containing protein [Pseudonocardiales bacterium]|nr:helix-turn-helix domain-containing protein [Pseudonocardiales bacterium]
MSTTIPGNSSSGAFSLGETAWILGVDESEVSRLIRVGLLPTIRRRSQLVVPTHALARLLPPPSERRAR